MRRIVNAMALAIETALPFSTSHRSGWDRVTPERKEMVVAAANAVLAVLRSAKGGAWQPIRTAPKYKRGGDIPDAYVVWLYDPDAQLHLRVRPAFWNTNYNNKRGGWESLESRDGYSDRFVRPTHWMPYLPPEPPTVTA